MGDNLDLGGDRDVERWREISNQISSEFRGSWKLTPLASADCDPDMQIAWSDGVAISQASMPPMELLNRGSTKAEKSYQLTRVNQRSILLIEGADPLTLGPGELVFLNSDVRCRWTVRRPYVTDTLHIAADLLLAQVPDPRKLLGRKLSCPYGLQESIMRTMDSAARIAEEGRFEDHGHRLVQSAICLLALIAEHDVPSRREQLAAIDTRCEQIKNLIGRNYATPGFSVDDIARSLQISSRYVQLALANEGSSPSELVKKYRLEAASHKLQSAESVGQTITQIALDCGFNSSSHFSTEFRKAFQVSPREYRANAMHAA